ncbi:5'-nucleotidase C-terminal domain-containing protein [Oscillatoria sp. FACHB-1407]|uniref:5'-nucleotidase C-terminal domain-containing protein n=1 Tax=Oscillatoria sp. FACHB-1407 TaxID=2692847 RepID=UPI0018F01ED1|nr:5'-nucleotidase C-terminal domain-containing protein [Oscillatoria sp. FACHB-1407]
MPFTLQLLHASDFEAGIPAIDDAVRFSAILNYFQDSSTGQFAASPTVRANTLTLSSGDNYLPGPFFNASSDTSLNGVGGLGTSTAPVLGRADIAILNAFGIQASALGNHEFDLGIRQVRDILRPGSGNPGTAFPYLSANLDFAPEINSGRGDLAQSDLATNQNTAEANTIRGKIAKSTIITLPGNDGLPGTGDEERIGIVGATTPTLRQISSPGSVGVLPANPVDYDALAAEIQRSVDALTAAGINKIILLSHMQQLFIERDELARRLRNVDIIIAGGSHTPLLDSNDVLRPGTTDEGDYPILRTSASNEPVLVLNTDANYRYVGRLVATFTDAGLIDTNSLNNTLNGAFATDEAGVDRVYGADVNPRTVADANVVAITDALRNAISAKDSNITGRAPVFLNGTRSDVRTQETNLGNLTADANLFYVRQVDPTTVISLKNGGGIRDNIGTVAAAPGATDPNDVDRLPTQPNPLAPNKREGDVSQLDIENSLRFNNGLSLITLTATQLKEVLEHGVSGVRPGATPGAFPQISGISFSFDPNGTAQVLATDGTVTTPGTRVRSIAVTDANGNFVDVVAQNGQIVGNPNRTFRVVALDFLLGTGAGGLTASGDGYPFFRYIRENPTLANRVDLRGETTVDLNRNGRIDPAVFTSTGQVNFSAPGTEQDALAEFLRQQTTPFSGLDVAPNRDRRIQNLSAREDNVFGLVLQGNNRPNRFRGRGADDTISGLGGNDRMVGLAGDDVLLGGAGNDVLDGGTGNDVVNGGIGNNTARGAAGNDIFVLERGVGRTLVVDFRNTIDRLGLGEGVTLRGIRIREVGNNTVISFGRDELAVLRGVDRSAINRRDFTSVIPEGEVIV